MSFPARMEQNGYLLTIRCKSVHPWRIKLFSDYHNLLWNGARMHTKQGAHQPVHTLYKSKLRWFCGTLQDGKKSSENKIEKKKQSCVNGWMEKCADVIWFFVPIIFSFQWTNLGLPCISHSLTIVLVRSRIALGVTVKG